MISFMFATLGAVGFWVIYFGLSLVTSTITLKIMAPLTFGYLTGKTDYSDWDSADRFGLVMLTITHVIFWPFILCMVVIYFVSLKVVGPVFCKALKSIDKMIPTIKFEKEEEK